MKIALAQINPTVGDLKGNFEKARDFVQVAISCRADLVVFPELSTCGYPPKDLLNDGGFLSENEEWTRKWTDLSTDKVGILFGAPSLKWGKLYNSAILAYRGKVLAARAKSLLPTYDVFDEARYFKPGPGPENPIPFKGIRLSVSLCEEFWNCKDFWTTEECRYSKDPLADCAPDSDILINISASPFALGKQELKDRMLRHIATKWGKPVIYVNQVGGQDDIVFDGRSSAYDSNGNMVETLKPFEEELSIVTLEGSLRGRLGASLALVGRSDAEEAHDALVLGIRDYARKTGFSKAVIGISGGIDSALVACLAAEALGAKNVLGVSMPSKYSSEGSRTDAEVLTKNLGISFRTIPIGEPHSSYMRTLNPVLKGGSYSEEVELWEENLQARVRGTILMAISNKEGRLLLSTGNKSEIAMGYFTQYGDSCGGLAVIGDLFKTLVYKVAEDVNSRANRDGRAAPIPKATMNKPPSAELKPGQLDSDSLPNYGLLDKILMGHIEDGKSPEEIAESLPEDLYAKNIRDPKFVREILDRMNRQEFKRRQLAPSIRITKKAFGTGRQMPIANGWRP